MRVNKITDTHWAANVETGAVWCGWTAECLRASKRRLEGIVDGLALPNSAVAGW